MVIDQKTVYILWIKRALEDKWEVETMYDELPDVEDAQRTKQSEGYLTKILSSIEVKTSP